MDDATRYEIIDDWRETCAMMVDPDYKPEPLEPLALLADAEFAEWALEVAYEMKGEQ